MQKDQWETRTIFLALSRITGEITNIWANHSKLEFLKVHYEMLWCVSNTETIRLYEDVERVFWRCKTSLGSMHTIHNYRYSYTLRNMVIFLFIFDNTIIYNRYNYCIKYMFYKNNKWVDTKKGFRYSSCCSRVI